ncbi:MAG TPA: DUF2784 family protein [Chryseolinea sp.]
MDTLLLYKIGNTFFFVFHVVLIFFNLFGWIPRLTRKLNLITLLFTAFSWLILGIFYGLGYCFLTDWHWQIRDELGYSNESNSYIHFLILKLTGLSLNESQVNIFTAIFFCIALGLSIFFNIRDRRQKRGRL